jgi:hypothetical protein
MHRVFRRLALGILLVALFIPLSVSVALAHGHAQVGDYELVIGFRNEPAYQGEPNGLDLRVTNKQTGQPVKGLEDTLKAELSFGSSKRELAIKPQWGKDGAYTADIIPTAAGDYTWHIFGTIEGTPADVTMTSSPETFSSIQAKGEVAFPAAETTAAELQAQAAAAASTAQAALIVGGLGGLLGVAGIVVGVLGLRARRATGAPAPGQAQRAA